MSRTNKDVDSKVESGGACYNNNSGTINNTTNYYGNVGDFHAIVGDKATTRAN